MQKISNNQKGFSVGQVLLVVVVLGLIGGVGYYVYQRQNKSMITTFEECKAAGNPIMESYPEQCSVDGKTYTNPNQQLDKAVTDSTDETTQPKQKYLEVKELDIKLPLDAEISGAYYEVRSPSTDPLVTYIEIFDAGFDKEKNQAGIVCKNENFPLFVIGRITIANYNKKIAQGYEENTIDLNFDKPLSFNSNYRYTGAASHGSPPGCAFVGPELRELDENVLEVFNAKKKAFGEAYIYMQDL